MKKLITSLVAVAVIGVAGLSAAEFSIGGSFGSEVNQNTSSALYGKPDFAVFADLQFDNFGLEFDFDINWETYKEDVYNVEKADYSLKYKRSEVYESFVLTPYFPIEFSKITLCVGPSLGLGLGQWQSSGDFVNASNTLNYTGDYKENYTYFIYGGTLQARYALSDSVKLVLSVPVLARNGRTYKRSATTDNVVQKTGTSSYYQKVLVYSVPKLGLMITF